MTPHPASTDRQYISLRFISSSATRSLLGSNRHHLWKRDEAGLTECSMIEIRASATAS
jgi:hypothetical protein